LEIDLRASVRRTYRLAGKRLLLLDDSYEGGAESGDWIEVELPDASKLRVQIEGIAWGSAFGAQKPPLTLIVPWGDDPDPAAGASVRGVAPA
jgi:hypothetical protein